MAKKVIPSKPATQTAEPRMEGAQMPKPERPVKTIHDWCVEMRNEIMEAEKASKLRSVTELTQAVTAQGELAFAITTGRHEFIRMAKPRPLSEQECAQVYKLISVLIQTNDELQRRNQNVADWTVEIARILSRIDVVTRGLPSLHNLMLTVRDYANFGKPGRE